MKFLKICLSLALVNLGLLEASSQETLQDKYDGLIEKSESYQQYKVIPRTELTGLWNEVQDSLTNKNESINSLKADLASQKSTKELLDLNISNLEAKLDESLSQNESISFLGMSFSKTGYHLMAWSIIIVVTVLGLVAYFMFMRSNRVTVRVKKDYEELNAAFEEHRSKAREAQIKLKRELQTAMNQLNERRN